MAVHVGSAVATINVDTSNFEKGLSTASDKYKQFIDQSEQVIGFNGTSQALSQLTKAISDLAQLEDWTTAQRIEGYEKVQHLYENNMVQQMNLELKLHDLRKKQFDEEYQMQMKRIQSMKTGDPSTTDFAAVINAYEGLKDSYNDDYGKIAEIEKQIVKAAEERKDKILKIKQEEINGIISENNKLLAENERTYNANKVLRPDESAYTVEFYYKQIEANRKLINELSANEAALTNTQKAELDKRIEAEADYYSKIEGLVNKGIVEKQKAEAEITDIVKRANEERLAADEEYYQKSSQIQRDTESQKNQLYEDYLRQVDEINKRTIENEGKVTAAYENAMQTRKSAASNFFSLFQQVKEKDITGEELLGNLKGQLDAINSFQQNIEKLKGKGLDTDIINSLLAMGPSYYNEIAALNQLSLEELKEYERLYKEKARLASSESESNMAAQRLQLERELAQVKSAASTSIGELTAAYNEKVKRLEEQTSIELDKLNKTWTDTHKDIEQKTSEEIKKQEENITKTMVVRKSLYVEEQKTVSTVEKEKTENIIKENSRRELEIRQSVARNNEAVRESVPVWYEIGLELGENLLNGIVSTRDKIVKYLKEVSDSVNSASQGGDVNVGDPSTGSFYSMGYATAFDDGFGSVTTSMDSYDRYISNSLVLGGGQLSIDYNKLENAVSSAIPNKFQNINYNPVYNSPKAATISELVTQDRINMRRLGLNLT